MRHSVILIHGFPGGAADFDPLAGELRARGRPAGRSWSATTSGARPRCCWPRRWGTASSGWSSPPATCCGTRRCRARSDSSTPLSSGRWSSERRSPGRGPRHPHQLRDRPARHRAVVRAGGGRPAVLSRHRQAGDRGPRPVLQRGPSAAAGVARAARRARRARVGGALPAAGGGRSTGRLRRHARSTPRPQLIESVVRDSAGW